MKKQVIDECSNCGHPQDDHIQVLKSEEWNAAGMGFIHSYHLLCPTLPKFKPMDKPRRGLGLDPVKDQA